MTDPSAANPVPSPWDLRADLVARVTADLLGPLDGENEVICGYQLESGKWSSPGRVRDRYLVGMLAPRGTVAADPERDDDVGPEEGDDTAGGVQDGRIPRLVMAQSSMGLSVVVDGSVDRLVVRCRWGQYLREFQDQPRRLPGGGVGSPPSEKSTSSWRSWAASSGRWRSTARGSCCGVGLPARRRGRGW